MHGYDDLDIVSIGQMNRMHVLFDCGFVLSNNCARLRIAVASFLSMHFSCIDRKRVGLSSNSGFNESEEKPSPLPRNMHGLDRLLRLAGCEARAYDGE